jgi:hypothetical protein
VRVFFKKYSSVIRPLLKNIELPIIWSYFIIIIIFQVAASYDALAVDTVCDESADDSMPPSTQPAQMTCTTSSMPGQE